MRIAKSVTLDLAMWQTVEKISEREHIAVSRVLENLLARGVNAKAKELNEAFKEIVEARKE